MSKSFKKVWVVRVLVEQSNSHEYETYIVWGYHGTPRTSSSSGRLLWDETGDRHVLSVHSDLADARQRATHYNDRLHRYAGADDLNPFEKTIAIEMWEDLLP